MIVSNRSRMFGFSHFGVVRSSTFGCAVITAPEGLFKGCSTVFQAFEGEDWAGARDRRLIAKAMLYPSLSKKDVATAHDAFLKRLDELGSSGCDLAAVIDHLIAEAKETGLVVDFVTDAGKRAMEATRSASHPQRPWESARDGAKIRSRLIALIEKCEAENNTETVGFAEKEGVMVFDPKLIELIRSQGDADEVPGDVLELSLESAFPTPAATRQVNEAWPSLVASYRGKPNTESLLAEKAFALTAFVANNLNVATSTYRQIHETLKKQPLTDAQMTAVRLEEAVVWIMVVMNFAAYLKDDFRLFMDWFNDYFARVLALQGTPPDMLLDTLQERTKEYAEYQTLISELLPDNGKSSPVPPGLLLKAGDYIGNAIGLSDNLSFSLQFAIRFYGLNKQAMIYELLTGREAVPPDPTGQHSAPSGDTDEAGAGEQK